jgi:hypothetical protein
MQNYLQKGYSMQIFESEIVIHLNYKPRFKRMLIEFCVFFAIYTGGFSFLLISELQMVDRTSNFPAIQHTAQQNIGQAVIGLFLGLLLFGLISLFLIRQMRAPSPYMRISDEGIFTSGDSLLIYWSEIKELSRSTFMGFPFLRIVTWNLEEVASRAKASSRPLFRFGINITLGIFTLLKSPAPIGIYQMSLPVSIDKLLTTIHERFAAKLRENRITVRGWQH